MAVGVGTIHIEGWKRLIGVGTIVAVVGAACSSGAPSPSASAAGSAPTSAPASADASPVPSTAAEPVDLDYAQYGTAANAQTLNSIAFADEVRSATDGLLDITVRPSGELPYTPDEFLRRVGDGTIDMAEALGAFIAGDCPVAGIPGFPFLTEDAAERTEMWDDFRPIIEACFDRLGAKFVWSFGFPTVQIFGKGEPPATLEDLRGLKIRQLGAESTEWLQALGVEPVTLPTAEVAGAMQLGVIDGFITSADTTNTLWAELADWAYLLNLGVTPQYVFMNRDVYDSLAPEVRVAFDAAAEKWEAESTSFFAGRDANAMASLEQEHGYTIVTPTTDDLARAKQLAVEKWETWAANLAGDDGVQALTTIREALGK